MKKAPQNLSELNALINIVSDLRGPDGCPWDKEQTHQSLTRYAIEECYEFIEAVNNQDYSEMKDELGDVLLQVILHAQIASEDKHFTINDVIESVSKKMIRRHPHVYASTEVSNSKEVLVNWDEIKKQEKKNKPLPKDSFALPKKLAPLIKSLKLGEKAAQQKFDWEKTEHIVDKIREETNEVTQALDAQNLDEVTNEIGDLLFATCQLARKLGVNPETALHKTNVRFEQRFFKMKNLIESEGKSLDSISNDEKEKYWQKIKQ